MIKDLIVSFKESLKKKSTNPFLGTYTIVLFIRNWEIIYSIFNFDKQTNRLERIGIILGYISERTLVRELLENVLWTFCAIIATYILINISRLIINFFEKNVTPWVYKITDINSVVTKETYNILNAEKKEVENKLEKEREQRIKYQREIETLETKLTELNIAKSESPSESDKGNQFEPKEWIESDAAYFAKKIKNEKLTSDYISTTTHLINNHNWIRKDKINSDFKYYLSLGLYQKTNSTLDEEEYKITQEGKEVLKTLRREA